MAPVVIPPGDVPCLRESGHLGVYGAGLRREGVMADLLLASQVVCSLAGLVFVYAAGLGNGALPHMKPGEVKELRVFGILLGKITKG